MRRGDGGRSSRHGREIGGLVVRVIEDGIIIEGKAGVVGLRIWGHIVDWTEHVGVLGIHGHGEIGLGSGGFNHLGM